ncbi:MAG: hypothetical protein ACKOYM_10290, partial [Actinomycetes bacterium]
PDIGQDAIALRGLLEQAHERLCDLGLRSPHAWELLAPHRALLGRLDFWLHQSIGLALFASPGFHRRYRVPLPFEREVTVGTHFRVRPLLPLPSGDGQFTVLALSPQRVRLFAATLTTFTELPLATIPSDEASAVAFDDPERQSHVRSPLGRGARLHGHGGDDPPDAQEMLRFLVAVDRGLHDLLGATPGPVVVAGVTESIDDFLRVARRPDLVVGRVAGNPDHLSAQELHDRSLAAAQPAFDAERRRAVEQLRESPDDEVVVDLAEIARAAEEGRVSSLLVAVGPSAGTWAGDTLDRAIAATLGHGGTALAVDPVDLRRSAGPAAVPPSNAVLAAEAAALLRG